MKNGRLYTVAELMAPFQPPGAAACRSPNPVRLKIIDVSAAAVDPHAVMVRLLLVLLRGLRAALRSHTNLALENLALRQQLASFASASPRPRISAADRIFWVTLRRLWSRWADVLVFVKPGTVIRGHRAGFRRYWTWLSRHRRRGYPSIDGEVRASIRRMATENPT